MKRPENARKKIIKACDVIARTFFALDTDGLLDICIWKDERFTYEDKFGMSIVSYTIGHDGLAESVSLIDVTEKLMSFSEIAAAFRDRVSQAAVVNIAEIKRRISK